MWTYRQSDGSLFHNGKFIAFGYSGHGVGKNSPVRQAVHDVGPIPCGKWKISAFISHTDAHGPNVIRLVAMPGTETFGRDGFLIHGDSISEPGTASHGCIILGPAVRKMMWESKDYDLEVRSGLVEQQVA